MPGTLVRPRENLRVFMRAMLLCLVLIGSGCVAGGGGSNHAPPEPQSHAEDTVIDIRLSVWGSGSEDITERYSDVKIAFGSGKHDMQLVDTAPSAGPYRYIIPAGTHEAGSTVPYTISFSLDGHPGNRTGHIEYLEDPVQRDD